MIKFTKSLLFVLLVTVASVCPMDSNRVSEIIKGELKEEVPVGSHWCIPPGALPDKSCSMVCREIRVEIRVKDKSIKALVSERKVKLSDIPMHVWFNVILGYVPRLGEMTYELVSYQCKEPTRRKGGLLHLMETCKFLLLVVLYHMRKLRDSDFVLFKNPKVGIWIDKSFISKLIAKLKVAGEDCVANFLPRFKFAWGGYLKKVVSHEYFPYIKAKILDLEMYDCDPSYYGLCNTLNLDNFPNIKFLSLTKWSEDGLRGKLDEKLIGQIESLFAESWRGNAFSGDFSSFAKLKKLSVNGVKICKLNENMTDLHSVALNINDFKNINFNYLNKVKILIISTYDDKVYDDKVYGELKINVNFFELRKLELSRVPIKCIDFYRFKNLRELRLFNIPGIVDYEKKLAPLKNLRRLEIRVNDWTDKGIEELRNKLRKQFHKLEKIMIEDYRRSLH